MKFLSLIIFLNSLLFCELIIVTNKNSNINSLSKESIKYLYLAKVNKINGVKIKTLLSKNKKLHKEFVNNVINKSVLQYNSYWTRLVFTGRKSIPKRLDMTHIKEELLKLNTIVYIKPEDYDPRWKVINE